MKNSKTTIAFCLRKLSFYRIGKANLMLTTPSPNPPSTGSIIQTYRPLHYQGFNKVRPFLFS